MGINMLDNNRMSKKLVLLLLLITIVASMPAMAFDKWTSINQVETGVEPHFLIHDTETNKLHVFCCGVDINWNFTYDEGEAYPSWCVIDLNSKTLSSTEITEFDFLSFSMTGFRPAADIKNRKIYIPNGQFISIFSLDDYSKIDEIDAGSTVAAVDYNAERDLLVASVNPIADEEGKILFYKGTDQVGEFSAGIYTKDVRYDNVGDVDVLSFICDGNLYGTEPSFHKYILDPEDLLSFSHEILNTGFTPNHLVANPDATDEPDYTSFVASNGSHNIMPYYLSIEMAAMPIYTGTNGWDGARQMFLSSNEKSKKIDEIYVTSYSGDFRIIDHQNGNEVIDIIPTAGKPEGIIKVGEHQIFVANQLDDFYGPMNIIEVFEKREFPHQVKEDYQYYDVPHDNGGISIFQTLNAFYVVNPQEGISMITDGVAYTGKTPLLDPDYQLASETLLEFNIDAVCKPEFLPESNHLFIASADTLYNIKIEYRKATILHKLSLSFTPERLSVQYDETDEFGQIYSVASVFNADSIQSFLFLNDGLYGGTSSEKVELNTWKYVKNDSFIFRLLGINDNSAMSIQFVENETYEELDTLDGFSFNTDIALIDTILYITDYTSRLIVGVNAISGNFEELFRNHIPISFYWWCYR
ncbi:MAG: hypothetical protein B7C24_16015 [Bacteroidetes bacterium 4572_77]|nr:MAG: hypothetical protein B7C24_16015 [Bacteroidetes bacterium 4572_77]